MLLDSSEAMIGLRPRHFGRVVNLEYKATSLGKSSQELAANVKGACSYQHRRNRTSRHSGFDGRSGNAHEPTTIGRLKGKLNERLRFMQPFSLTCRTVEGLGLAAHRSSSFDSKQDTRCHANDES